MNYNYISIIFKDLCITVRHKHDVLLMTYSAKYIIENRGTRITYPQIYFCNFGIGKTFGHNICKKVIEMYYYGNIELQILQAPFSNEFLTTMSC